MGNDSIDKMLDGAIRGGAIGAGVQAIRGGKEWRGLADGWISGVVLGAAYKAVSIVSDRAGFTSQLNRAKNRILNRRV